MKTTIQGGIVTPYDQVPQVIRDWVRGRHGIYWHGPETEFEPETAAWRRVTDEIPADVLQQGPANIYPETAVTQPDKSNWQGLGEPPTTYALDWPVGCEMVRDKSGRATSYYVGRHRTSGVFYWGEVGKKVGHEAYAV